MTGDLESPEAIEKEWEDEEICIAGTPPTKGARFPGAVVLLYIDKHRGDPKKVENLAMQTGVAPSAEPSPPSNEKSRNASEEETSSRP
jgi:hypothetical protein